MIVKHSGSQTVFEVFFNEGEQAAVIDILDWMVENILGRYHTSRDIERNKTGLWRKTIWLDDREAAMLFKLRWVT